MRIKKMFTGWLAVMVLALTIATLVTALPAKAQQAAGTNYGSFSAAFAAPAFSGVGSATLTYTAGMLYQGGAAKSIVAGTLTSLDASQTSCAAPGFSACEFIYWTSGTGLSKTTAYTTATASGNILAAYVTTDGSSKVVAITPATLETQPHALPAVQGLTITAADGLTINSLIVPQTQTITYRCTAAADCLGRVFFIADAAYEITGVNAVWSTAETTAANLRIQVEKLTGTTAPGSGTALLTNNTNNGISIKGTANTVTAGTLTGTTASLQLAAGDRVGVKYETTPTEGAGVVVTVTVKRI